MNNSNFVEKANRRMRLDEGISLPAIEKKQWSSPKISKIKAGQTATGPQIGGDGESYDAS